MALFRRKNKPTTDSTDTSETKKDKQNWRRPANTAFKQQRLKAWQPILTPKTVLPTLFIIGIVFAPIGALLIWGNSRVTEMTFEYTNCDTIQPSESLASLNLVDIPKYSYQLRAGDSKAQYNPPQYALIQNSTAALGSQSQCVIHFDVPADLDPSILLYYKLTNFYQNHRRYVDSLDADQLKGKHRTVKDLRSGTCKPVAIEGDRVVYPCGLIANSLFNDTFSGLTLLNPAAGESPEYTMSEKNIAWPGEAKKYVAQPDYQLSEIVPPPNWRARYPDGYTESNPPPNLKEDEHFQNWMRTAGLPTFTKLYSRNDSDKLSKGRYQIVVNMNFPVKPYKGTKSIVISTVSWIGGKNPFLGWAYVAAAALFVLLAVLGTIRHLVRPRRLGDMSLLSWNR